MPAAVLAATRRAGRDLGPPALAQATCLGPTERRGLLRALEPKSCQRIMRFTVSEAPGLAHEGVGTGNTVLDRLHRRCIREADMLAVARNAAAEMDVRQHGDAGLVEEPLPKSFRIGAARALAGFGNVRPRVERASRRLARETRHPIQKLDDQVAPLEKRMPHRLRRILGPSDRLDGRPLTDLRGAGFGVDDPQPRLLRDLGL